MTPKFWKQLSKKNYTRQSSKTSISEQSKSTDQTMQNNHVIIWPDAKVHESIWFRKRASNAMNRDEGGHTFLGIPMIHV